MPTTVQPLRPYTLFTHPNGTLTIEGYNFLYNMYLRIGGSLDSLNAATLADKTWESPNPIGTVDPNIGEFTTLEAADLLVTGTTTLNGGTFDNIAIGSTTASSGRFTNLTVTTSVNNNGGGLKHARGNIVGLAAGASTNVTFLWPTAFADANYTVNVNVVSAGIQLVRVTSVLAGQVSFDITNPTGALATGVYHAIAMHD